MKKWNCEEDGHDWDYQKDTKFELGGLGETVERPIKCNRCDETGREVWIYGDVIEDGVTHCKWCDAKFCKDKECKEFLKDEVN